MAETSSIEWTDATFNPWMGCTKVSPGCDHCYAEARLDTRLHVVGWGAGQPRKRTSARNWSEPVKWNDQHAEFFARHGRRRRVFCASLADVFDNEVPSAWRQDLMSLIVRTPNLDWLLLTKRIGNAKRMLSDASMHDGLLLTSSDEYRPPANLWLGATIVNQEEADRDIPKLLATPAAVRFLSMEPLLGSVDLTTHLWGRPKACDDCPKDADCECGYARRGKVFNDPALHWVIVGGESGHHARPMHPDWARSLRDQCAAAAVSFLFKQWGEWGPDWEGAETCTACGRTKFDAINWYGECGHCGINSWDPAERPLDKPRRVGKKAAGRLLDGRTHDGFPEGVREVFRG